MARLSIIGHTRNDFGKGAVRRLRKTGQMPGVVYGGDSEPKSIQIRHDDVFHSLENDAFYSSILDLEIDGVKEKVILRDLERHPARVDILHVDFQRINSKVPISMLVPLNFVNADVSPGVKLGGSLDILFNDVTITCLPDDLPESIEVDLAEMNFGDSVYLTEIKMPKGVEITSFIGMTDEEISNHDQSVVSLHENKVSEEEESTDAPTAPDSPEVTTGSSEDSTE